MHNELKEELKLLGFEINEVNNHSAELIGTVENVSKHMYTYVEVQFNAYDAEGYQVDSIVASVNNLEPNGKWKFNSPVTRKGKTARLIRLIADDGDTEKSAIYV